jgi:hypothetical protein
MPAHVDPASAHEQKRRSGQRSPPDRCSVDERQRRVVGTRPLPTTGRSRKGRGGAISLLASDFSPAARNRKSGASSTKLPATSLGVPSGDFRIRGRMQQSRHFSDSAGPPLRERPVVGSGRVPTTRRCRSSGDVIVWAMSTAKQIVVVRCGHLAAIDYNRRTRANGEARTGRVLTRLYVGKTSRPRSLP